MIATFAALLAALGLLLAACAHAPPPQTLVVTRAVMLPEPERPTLTPIPASAFIPLTPAVKAAEPALAPADVAISNATYTILVERERQLRTWALELAAAIEANNRAATASPHE